MVAEIFIWGKKVGAVSWNELRQHARLEFFPNFEKEGLDLAPINMPLEKIREGKRLFGFPHLSRATFRGLPGLLADSLPDDFGNQVIDAWLAAQGLAPESFSPVDRLCYIGNRGMGALEFRPAKELAFSKSVGVEVSKLVELASSIVSREKQVQARPEVGESLLDIVRVSSSAGGARAKALLAIDPKTGEVRSGQVDAPEGFEHWLLKFDGVEDQMPRTYGRIEYAYYLMAKACGIEIVESRLMEENGRAHFMTRRFDRPENGRKIHQQTLCALAHLDYYLPSSYERAFQVMRQMRMPVTQAEKLFRRMCFNIMARNLDDHTKNISFLMNEEGNWKLSPAYDLVYAFGPEFKRHKMSVNGKYAGLEKEDLLSLAREMNIKAAKYILEEVSGGIRSWKDCAIQANISPDQIQEIGQNHLNF